jgi:hypothetical protein
VSKIKNNVIIIINQFYLKSKHASLAQLKADLQEGRDIYYSRIYVILYEPPNLPPTTSFYTTYVFIRRNRKPTNFFWPRPIQKLNIPSFTDYMRKPIIIKTIWLLLKIAYLVIINIIWSCIKELRTKVLKYQTKVLKMNSSSKQELLYVGKVIKALPCLLDEFIFSTLVRYFSTLVHNFGTVIRNIHNNCLGIALWNVTWNRLFLHLSTHLKHSHRVG